MWPFWEAVTGRGEQRRSLSSLACGTALEQEGAAQEGLTLCPVSGAGRVVARTTESIQMGVMGAGKC